MIILFLKDDVSLIEYFTKIQCSEDDAKRNVYVPSSVKNLESGGGKELVVKKNK